MSINTYPSDDPRQGFREQTAFGELRVAESTPVIQVDFPYNINARLIKDRSGGGGTLTQASGMAICSTSASTNASGLLETTTFLNYSPGQGSLARFTSLYTLGVAGSIQTVGIGDEFDGFFFGYDGTDFGVLCRRDGVDKWIVQADWNHGVFSDFDPTLGNVYQISYQWLGFGGIVFSIEDPITTRFEPVHVVHYANTELVPSILNPSLPLCMLAENITNDTNLTVRAGSLSAFIDGRLGQTGIINASGIAKTVGTIEVPVIAFRNNAFFQGRKNRTVIDLLTAFASNDGNKTAIFRLVLNPVLVGANFVELDADTSTMSVDTEASSFTNGITLAKHLISGDSSDSFDLNSLQLHLPPGTIIGIVAKRLAGADALVDTGLVWREKP